MSPAVSQSEIDARARAYEAYDRRDEFVQLWMSNTCGSGIHDERNKEYADKVLRDVFVDSNWRGYACLPDDPQPTTSDDSPDQILYRMAETFAERNKTYGDNYLKVGQVMEILHGNDAAFPASKLVGTAEQFNVWHLYELMIVKLTRFAISGLTHKDSIHDLAVYAAMVESLVKEPRK